MNDKDRDTFPKGRFSEEREIAFITMLAVGANNKCDDELWKDLCNEAGRRLLTRKEAGK